jgi:hypothetical protein
MSTCRIVLIEAGLHLFIAQRQLAARCDSGRVIHLPILSPRAQGARQRVAIPGPKRYHIKPGIIPLLKPQRRKRAAVAVHPDAPSPAPACKFVGHDSNLECRWQVLR